MSEEELVVCLCGRGEGDGLMVQCDLCLTWQHGTCLNIFTEEQVGRGEWDRLMVQCDLCLTWEHGTCLNIFTEEQVIGSTYVTWDYHSQWRAQDFERGWVGGAPRPRGG